MRNQLNYLFLLGGYNYVALSVLNSSTIRIIDLSKMKLCHQLDLLNCESEEMLTSQPKVKALVMFPDDSKLLCLAAYDWYEWVMYDPISGQMLNKFKG